MSDVLFDPPAAEVAARVDALRHEVDDHWQVPADEARLLAQLVLVAGAKSICEIGTSYGFSTLHLAAAVRRTGGNVHTFDISRKKVEAAGRHLREAGLDDVVTVHEGDARQSIGDLPPDLAFDFVFFDATKAESHDYLTAIRPRLAARALLVTDNTTTHADELNDFVAELRRLPGAIGCQVSVGNGFDLTLVQA